MFHSNLLPEETVQKGHCPRPNLLCLVPAPFKLRFWDAELDTLDRAVILSYKIEARSWEKDSELTWNTWLKVAAHLDID